MFVSSIYVFCEHGVVLIEKYVLCVKIIIYMLFGLIYLSLMQESFLELKLENGKYYGSCCFQTESTIKLHGTVGNYGNTIYLTSVWKKEQCHNDCFYSHICKNVI